METKKCSKCGDVKNINEFHKKGKNYQSMCMLCRIKYHKDWYLKNAEKRKKQIRDYKHNNKEQIKIKRDESTKTEKLKIKFIEDLNLINSKRYVFYLGNKKDLLAISNDEFSKLKKIFIIKGCFSENIKIIEEVKNAR